MQSNDIAVDINVLSSCGRKLGKTLNELEQFASVLKHNLAIAGRDFDSANFERAEQVIDSVIGKLGDAADRLDAAQTYLGELEARAENYLRCRYGG